jgi:enoyl-CoA hydratase
MRPSITRVSVVSELVLSDTHDRVCTITLNRPDARNAMNSELQRDLAAALAAAEADDDVDVVVLTGADPAFCAGLDLRELGSTAANLVGGRDGAHRSPFTVLWTMTKPVIGAINGAAVTGGFELALACDFLVASERATFGDTHARVGVTPGGGMSVFLPQTVGLRKAKEMSLTGNFIDAHEALALYDRGAKLSVGDALALEHERFRDFRVDPSEIERRRADVVERGRGQQR